MLLRGLRDRISGVFAGIAIGVFMLLCGAIMAFVISPQQALEWRRIEDLPQMDASTLAAVQAGDEVVITGTLQGNAELNDAGMVAYFREQWVVEPPDPEIEDDKPEGDWKQLDSNIPALALEAQGTVNILAGSPKLEGNTRQMVNEAQGTPVGDFSGDEAHAEGSVRTVGFNNGDLVTVQGDKASTGGVAPRRLFGGDRVQLVESIKQSARAAFTIGIGMMICAPLVAVATVLGSIFGRRRRGL